MILNLSGRPVNNLLEISQITLPFGNYSFVLLNLVGILENPPKFSEILEITCDLIVRDVANPHRVIGYFHIFENENIVNFTPTHFCEYKLRVFDISSLELKIRGLASDKNLHFSQVALQIKIEETYARFQ